MRKHLIVIAGPTASGKSQLATTLAQKLDTEIISCDSRQIYREMTIGTAKPSREDMSGIKHHFIDHISIHEEYSAGKFEMEAIALIDRLFQHNPRVIAAGGSGLYIKALIDGLDNFPKVDPAIREKYKLLFKKNGLDPLVARLRGLDEEYYREVDLKNPQRVIRALSFIEATGQAFSQFRSGRKKKRNFDLVPIMIYLERENLYHNINNRVDHMLTSGLLEEAKSLFPYRHLACLQTVGYQELFAHLNGEIDLQKAVELIKQNTRRYAKRQLTWFRKYGEWELFHAKEFRKTLEFAEIKTRL